MRKIGFLLLIGFLLTSCGTAAVQSEFWQHDSMYRDWDHLKFSWYGHNSPTAESGKTSQSQKWWGIDVPYIPAK